MALIQKWEEDDQADLKKLAALINRIVDVVREGGGSAVVEYEKGGNGLVVERAGEGKILPEDLYVRWDDGEMSEKEREAVAESAASAVGSEGEGKNTAVSPGDMKGKKAVSAAEEGTQVPPS